MYTKHNGDNPKLRIFSFIPQRRRIQPNFMNHTYQTTTQITKTTRSTWVSPLTQSLYSYNWENANSGVFILIHTTEYNGDNPKLSIFSFIPQRRRIQPNFMNHTYQTTTQTNTTQTTKTTTSTWVSPLTQSLCSYNWDNANSGVFILTFQPISKNSYSTNLVHLFHPSPICTFHWSRKTCTWLDEQFHTFHPSLYESITSCLATMFFKVT